MLPPVFESIRTYILAHWDRFYTLLILQKDNGRIERWKLLIKESFTHNFPQKIGMKNHDLIIERMTSSATSVYIYWLDRPESIDTDAMIH